MVQLGDVQLGSADYMVEPGSYRRGNDGTPEGRPGRWVQNDFVAGMGRDLQLERELAFSGETVGPVMGGQGVEPWPLRTIYRDSAMRTVSSSRKARTQRVGSKVFLGYDRYIYELPAAGAAWANVVQRADLGAGKIVTSLMDYYGLLYIGIGNTGNIQVMDPLTYVVSSLSIGGRYIVPYAGKFMASNPFSFNEQTLQLSTGGGVATRDLDSEILGMCLHNSSVAIATRQGIYQMGGRPDPVTAGEWLGEPSPLFSSGAYSEGNDYVFLQSYGGKLYTWLFGQVMEWNPNAGNNRQGWRAVGIDGRTCYGACVSAGWLIVSTLSNQGAYEVWAFDGTGWWRMETTTVNARLWPVDLAGAGTYDFLAFRAGDANVDYQLQRLTPRSLAEPALNTDGSYTTSMIDAGERDKLKAWRTIAAYFAAPEIRHLPSSTDTVNIFLDYSIDNGKTWTQAATIATNQPATLDRTLSADLGNAAKVSRFLQLRVRWTSVLEWCPTLVGLMAEYELLDQPSRRRRWQLKVTARDETARRTGVDPRTGQQIAADLWAAWAAGTTVPMRDIDYDLAAVTYQVRVVGIEESRESTADAGQWAHSSIKLTLVEI